MGWNYHAVFVYGTLRKHDDNHALLAASPLLAEQGWVRGRLYDTGYGYPGLVLDGDGRVYGEVYRVTDEVLARLDILEGYEGPDQENDYERLIKTIETDRGRMQAYVYVYNHLSPRMPEIDWGDWKVYSLLKERANRPLLYFAFGSCMDQQRIVEAGVWQRFRSIGGKREKTRGILRNYRLAFTVDRPDGGRADIVESPGDTVEGVLYTIDQQAWSYLLERESAFPVNGPIGQQAVYRPALVDIETDGAMYRNVLTFTAVDKGKEKAPPLWYAQEIVRGAEGVVSTRYLAQLKQDLKRKFKLDV